jgi:hypothetical protein
MWEYFACLFYACKGGLHSVAKGYTFLVWSVKVLNKGKLTFNHAHVLTNVWLEDLFMNPDGFYLYW